MKKQIGILLLLHLCHFVLAQSPEVANVRKVADNKDTVCYLGFSDKQQSFTETDSAQQLKPVLQIISIPAISLKKYSH